MAEPAIEKAFLAESVFIQDEINCRRYELRKKNQRGRIAQMNYAIKEAVTEKFWNVDTVFGVVPNEGILNHLYLLW